MGYTHYWTWDAFVDEKNHKAALQDCRKIIRNSPIPLGNWSGEGKPTLRNGFSINGLGDEGHESFIMKTEPDRADWFCKTARKPYDIVVVACLCAMEDRLGKAFRARSDGDPHEWEAGRELASKVLKRDIKLPQDVIDQVTKYGWWARKYRKEHPEYEYTPLDISHPDHKNETIPEYAKG
jgi:hypothetical protein